MDMIAHIARRENHKRRNNFDVEMPEIIIPMREVQTECSCFHVGKHCMWTDAPLCCPGHEKQLSQPEQESVSTQPQSLQCSNVVKDTNGNEDQGISLDYSSDETPGSKDSNSSDETDECTATGITPASATNTTITRTLKEAAIQLISESNEASRLKETLKTNSYDPNLCPSCNDNPIICDPNVNVPSVFDSVCDDNKIRIVKSIGVGRPQTRERTYSFNFHDLSGEKDDKDYNIGSKNDQTHQSTNSFNDASSFPEMGYYGVVPFEKLSQDVQTRLTTRRRPFNLSEFVHYDTQLVQHVPKSLETKSLETKQTSQLSQQNMDQTRLVSQETQHNALRMSEMVQHYNVEQATRISQPVCIGRGSIKCCPSGKCQQCLQSSLKKEYESKLNASNSQFTNDTEPNYVKWSTADDHEWKITTTIQNLKENNKTPVPLFYKGMPSSSLLTISPDYGNYVIEKETQNSEMTCQTQFEYDLLRSNTNYTEAGYVYPLTQQQLEVQNLVSNHFDSQSNENARIAQSNACDLISYAPQSIQESKRYVDNNCTYVAANVVPDASTGLALNNVYNENKPSFSIINSDKLEEIMFQKNYNQTHLDQLMPDTHLLYQSALNNQETSMQLNKQPVYQHSITDHSNSHQNGSQYFPQYTSNVKEHALKLHEAKLVDQNEFQYPNTKTGVQSVRETIVQSAYNIPEQNALVSMQSTSNLPQYSSSVQELGYSTDIQSMSRQLQLTANMPTQISTLIPAQQLLTNLPTQQLSNLSLSQQISTYNPAPHATHLPTQHFPTQSQPQQLPTPLQLQQVQRPPAYLPIHQPPTLPHQPQVLMQPQDQIHPMVYMSNLSTQLQIQPSSTQMPVQQPTTQLQAQRLQKLQDQPPIQLLQGQRPKPLNSHQHSMDIAAWQPPAQTHARQLALPPSLRQMATEVAAQQVPSHAQVQQVATHRSVQPPPVYTGTPQYAVHASVGKASVGQALQIRAPYRMSQLSNSQTSNVRREEQQVNVEKTEHLKALLSLSQK